VDVLKFDLGSIVKNVHNALDPESKLPPDQEKNPLGYRASRLAELVKSVKIKHEELADELAKVETNLEEVVAELNKMTESKVEEKPESKEEGKSEPKEEDKKEDKK
jgi:hypothetical protein